MAETLTIKKENKLPPAEDYNFLRREGIRLIEKLSGRVWTDYNTHDPGITLLEALCYTLTDLGYRTGFQIKDLLSNSRQDGWDKVFYTARQILPCNPVTLTDYRKLIIDTEGVRNAWIEMSEDAEILMYLEEEKEDANAGPLYKIGYDVAGSSTLLRLRGLYKVFVEYDFDVLGSKKEEKVAARIREKLGFHRNLCEDFLSVTSIEYEDFRIEVELQVSEGSDIERINARIYKLIQDFFSPPVNFYTLEQMVEKGYTAEEIFEGPVLKYGFIDTKELERSERYKDIHLSDIMHLILGIEGVIAIKKFALPLESAAPGVDFSQWVSDIKDRQKVPRLNGDQSVVTFVRSGDRHRTGGIAEKRPDPQRVKAMVAFLQSAALKSKRKGAVEKDFQVGPGENMQVADYFPLQSTLPAAYGMAENYINERPDPLREPDEFKKEQLDRLGKRKKQTLQLRGFLMVFEQILSDYLAQLSNLRELFSFAEPGRQTQYARPVQGVQNLETLFIDFKNYLSSLQRMAENEADFTRRRDGMLDHLMGRFAESLDKYNGYLRATLGRAAGKKLLEDKIAFLSDYIDISNYRGKSFDYADREQVWDTTNVEGLKKRICRLTGIHDFSRKTIASDALFIEQVTVDNAVNRFVVVLTDPAHRGTVLLRSVEYEFRGEAHDTLTYILENGPVREQYGQEGRRDRWGYQLLRPTQEADREVIATSVPFKNREEAEAAFDKTLQTLQSFSADLSFHILEHMLLRPKISGREKTTRKSSLDTDTVSLLKPVDVSDRDPVPLEEAEKPAYRFDITHHRAAGRHENLLWKLALVDHDNQPLLQVEEDFLFYKHLTRRIQFIREFASDRSNFVTHTGANGDFYYSINDGRRPLAVSAKRFPNEADMEKEWEALIRFFSYEAPVILEGVDHFDGPGYFADPYSFRISIFIPAWPAKFRNPTFRHLLEKTIYLETPSHIHPEVYWLSHRQMLEFEEAYKTWLEELANTEIPGTDIVNNLIAVFNEVRK